MGCWVCTPNSPPPAPPALGKEAGQHLCQQLLANSGKQGQVGQGATRSCPWEHLSLAHTHPGAFGGRIALHVCVG